MVEYTIVNLVASANLNATLDLYNLAISVPDIEYEPEQFPGAILKLKEPKVSMLLFKNGKVICSGASSEAQIAQGIRKASQLIHEIQPSVKVLELSKVEYTVVNLVATANLHQTLDLFKTAMSLDNVEYEPEQFPGAILRITDPKITLLLFKNGKVICAGAKREDLLKQGLEKAAALIRGIKAEEKTGPFERSAPRVAEKPKTIEPVKIRDPKKTVSPKKAAKPKPAKKSAKPKKAAWKSAPKKSKSKPAHMAKSKPKKRK